MEDHVHAHLFTFLPLVPPLAFPPISAPNLTSHVRAHRCPVPPACMGSQFGSLLINSNDRERELLEHCALPATNPVHCFLTEQRLLNESPHLQPELLYSPAPSSSHPSEDSPRAPFPESTLGKVPTCAMLTSRVSSQSSSDLTYSTQCAGPSSLSRHTLFSLGSHSPLSFIAMRGLAQEELDVFKSTVMMAGRQ